MLVFPLHNGTRHIARQDRATSMSPGAKDSICHSRLTCCRGCDTTDWQSSASLKCKQLCQKEFFLIRRNLEATFYKNLLSPSFRVASLLAEISKRKTSSLCHLYSAAIKKQTPSQSEYLCIHFPWVTSDWPC